MGVWRELVEVVRSTSILFGLISSRPVPDASHGLKKRQASGPGGKFWATPIHLQRSSIVLSPEPDATGLPSGKKATEWTESEWPLSVCSGDKFLAFPTCTGTF